MRYFLILITMLLTLVISVRAQQLLNPEKIRQYVTFGYNIGASAPFGLPNTIREINSYSPAFTPS